MKTVNEILVGITHRIETLENYIDDAIQYNKSQRVIDTYEARLDEMQTFQRWIKERGSSDGNQNQTSL